MRSPRYWIRFKVNLPVMLGVYLLSVVIATGQHIDLTNIMDLLLPIYESAQASTPKWVRESVSRIVNDSHSLRQR